MESAWRVYGGLLILPGIWAVYAIGRLLISEYRMRRVFRRMPELYIEKREELCLALLPWTGGQKEKNAYLAKCLGVQGSGVYLAFLRILLVAVVLSLGSLVVQTNLRVLEEEMLSNMELGMDFIELQEPRRYDKTFVKQEGLLVKQLYTVIPEEKIRGGGMALELEVGARLGPSEGTTAGEVEARSSVRTRRIALKLQKMWYLHESPRPWDLLVLLAMLTYVAPLPLSRLKESMGNQKRRQEVIRLYENMLLYGEMPPYDLTSLTGFLLKSADHYKPLLQKIRAGVKMAMSEEVLELEMRNLKQQGDWGMVDLLEQLKGFYRTGILTNEQAIDGILERKRRMEEIQEEQRRNGKFQLGAIPLAVVIGLGAWYFMLGTLGLSNMGILGGK